MPEEVIDAHGAYHHGWSNWRGAMPPNGTGLDCVAAVGPAGEWVESSCEAKQIVICCRRAADFRCGETIKAEATDYPLVCRYSHLCPSVALCKE